MDDLVEFRRDLHAHPELARQERRTTAAVAQRLALIGLRPTMLPSGTGLTCDVGPEGGPVVALRADMDALPIIDAKNVPYKSEHYGVCHACGHDVHTAMLTGAAKELAALSREGKLPGKVRMIFQPAEESPLSGALDVIAQQALNDVAVIYAIHCDPSQYLGSLGLRVGAITSAQDRISVRLHGNGGHSARPQLTPNPINAIGEVIVRLSDFVNGRLSGSETTLIGFGIVHSDGAAANVIPSSVEAQGTVRISNVAVWPQMPQLVEEALEYILRPYGLEWDLEYTRVCPAVVNDPAATASLRLAAEQIVGRENVYEAPQSFGGEDFAWYLQQVPGALGRLGVRKPNQDKPVDLHSGLFDIDERAIAVGVTWLVRTAVLALQSQTSPVQH